VGSAQGTQPLATQGARLFQQLGCIACHRDDGLGPAPALVGVYGQPVHLQDGSQTVADDAYVRRSILDPTAQVVDGWQPIMPSFQGRVNEDEMSALIAYIRSIGPAGSTQTPEIPPSPSPVPSPSGSPTP
jgi:cytochrome c oxidase subunit 2